jgi:hypothetical protein
MGRQRLYRPIADEDERVHREIEGLRERVAVLEVALRQVYAAAASLVGPKAAPVRTEIGQSASGEQIFEDDPPERKADISRPRRQRWRPTSEPRSNDDTEGAWTTAQRQQMDARFSKAMVRQIETRKPKGRAG